MITPKEIESKTMTPEKEKEAKNDLFAFYVGRPLSYILTIPLLYTKITPNMISLLTLAPPVIGFVIMGTAKSEIGLMTGWLCFFLWNLLDGVDGNIARYKNEFSRMGSVYDAMSGYTAMVLSFFAWGWAASHNPGILLEYLPLKSEIYIILGALSGIFEIFPRLIMHKAMTTVNDESISEIKNKSDYGSVRLVALNLTSISGFVQVFMLLAILLNMLGLFTIGYFMINLGMMVGSLFSIFKDKGR